MLVRDPDPPKLEVRYRVFTGQGRLEKVGEFVVRERSGKNIFLKSQGK